MADLRASLDGRVIFELLDYPDIDRTSGEIRDFAGIVERTVERIRSLKSSGQVHIAGYSFGVWSASRRHAGCKPKGVESA